MTQTNLIRPGLGAVFTRPWAVDLVLDMAGYTPDKDLAAKRAVEPSCGGGAFLTAMIDRVAASCITHGRALSDAADAIWARDLDLIAVTRSRVAAAAALRSHGVSASRADDLACQWIREGDFLLEDLPDSDWVVGNPPYVRLEDVPHARYAEYRARWNTMTGRADVYVGFIQAGLAALRPGGTLAYICADRWMRNQYGSPLRRRIENDYSVDAVVTLHDSDPFEAPVAAYPAVFAIGNATQGSAFLAETDSTFGQENSRHLAELYTRGRTSTDEADGPGFSANWRPGWFKNAPSWPAGPPDRIRLVTALEDKHLTVGDPRSGVQVGIGLTTGADAIYLTRDADTIEEDQLLPMVMASDIKSGKVSWSGTQLRNPWHQSGDLIDLSVHPRARAYFTEHEELLRARYVGRRQPERWYRTVDRPIENLDKASKLLVADLRPRVTPVLEPGGLYPHHNLLWITSDQWDLRALGGLLLSDFGTLFVETYSPRMAGGALRVTAQYLRRICLPSWESISQDIRTAMADAFDQRDIPAATEAAAAAYGL